MDDRSRLLWYDRLSDRPISARLSGLRRSKLWNPSRDWKYFQQGVSREVSRSPSRFGDARGVGSSISSTLQYRRWILSVHPEFRPTRARREGGKRLGWKVDPLSMGRVFPSILDRVEPHWALFEKQSLKKTFFKTTFFKKRF